MRLPSLIPSSVNPPVTDQEWEEALKGYGLDREGAELDAHDSEEDEGASPSSGNRYRNDSISSATPYYPSSNPLIHHGESDDSLEGFCPGEKTVKHHTSRSTTAADQLAVPMSATASRSERGSIDSTASVNVRYNTLGLAGTVNVPTYAIQEDEDEMNWSAEAERARMRQHYEREGWLCGPQPSPALTQLRKKVIRQLGLNGGSREEPEREAVMIKYADLAALTLGTSKAAVTIMNDIVEVHQRGADVTTLTPDRALCSHSIIHLQERCTVIGDLSTDWRFKESHALKGYKFYASAPLRYYRTNAPPVDIGTLCVYDEKSWTHFDVKSQDILLNLANMLVYQLATLQSEIMAKRARSMYEANTAFLRRSILAPTKSADPLPPKHSPHKPQHALQDKPHLAHHTSFKAGPKEARNAKTRAEQANSIVLDDAANTLKGILGCDSVAIVGLEDYQLFIRKSNLDSAKEKEHKLDKEKVIINYTNGKPWPSQVDPVVLYTPKGPSSPRVLGSAGSYTHRFEGKGHHLSEIIPHYIKNRHFWWDREDEDELAKKFMSMVPAEARTSLMAALMTPDGTLWIAIFASWSKPPSDFGDFSRTAVPFAWILGSSAMAAMSIRKVRAIEQSQISYSNLQAHELRTPLHQILAITQLLRSSMNDLADAPQQSNNTLTTMQQVRDLLPFLDAIDTSGKTLHGIVDNILSFLDLKAKENTLMPRTPGMLASPAGAPQSLEVMFEELMEEACEEDKRVRSAKGQPQSNVETIFEIIPPLLGEKVTEDTGGALRKALSKILSNAYKFIESQGCVEIYVDDIQSMLPPEGCEDLSLTRMISIIIVDSGRGMEDDFVRDKLGEPWAKEDPYATGSGLSVHLAWRIIDLMGGNMHISSTPGGGCTVKLEVPVPRRVITTPNSPDLGKQLGASDPSQLAIKADKMDLKHKVGLLGYDLEDSSVFGLMRLGQALKRQFVKLGCEIVPIEEADIVVLDGRMEERPSSAGKHSLANYLGRIRTDNIVVLVDGDHEADPDTLAREPPSVRRFRKPTTPSILREILFPKHARQIRAEIETASGTVTAPINSPDQVDAHGHDISPDGKPRAHFSKDVKASTSKSGWLSTFWKPKNMDVEDAVASLCLGDYFSSRRKAAHPASSGSSSAAESTPIVGSGQFSDHLSAGVSSTSGTTPMDDDDTPAPETESETDPEPEPETVKVMVVEDNVINRKILVRILSSKLNIEVYEAEDGEVAVEQFKSFTSPAIVLLDINMPKMDGYQAATEMRAIEKRHNRSKASVIIAVTALASEDQKRKGLVECGIDEWVTKPFSKATIIQKVEKARRELAGEVE